VGRVGNLLCGRASYVYMCVCACVRACVFTQYHIQHYNIALFPVNDKVSVVMSTRWPHMYIYYYSVIVLKSVSVTVWLYIVYVGSAAFTGQSMAQTSCVS
jgi:hypothetical protein